MFSNNISNITITLHTGSINHTVLILYRVLFRRNFQEHYISFFLEQKSLRTVACFIKNFKETSLFVPITSIGNLHKESFHLGPPETKSRLMPSAEESRTFRRIAIIWLCMPRDFHHSSYCQIRFHTFPSHFSFRRPGISQSCLAFIFHYIIVGERKEFK